MKLNKIHHVAVICSDYAKSKHFYTDVLGMKIMSENYRKERDNLCLCDWNKMPCAEHNKNRLTRYMNADFKIETSLVLEQTKQQLDEYFWTPAGHSNQYSYSLPSRYRQQPFPDRFCRRTGS